jgi:nucleoside-diphosphate kinase
MQSTDLSSEPSAAGSCDRERTLLIIKPDAVASRVAGEILRRVAQEGFRLCALKPERLTPEAAGQFYGVHRNKPFFQSLVEFMVSGPIMVAVLEKVNAVRDLRSLIGATDPRDASEGTIRKEFAQDGRRNAVHASDSRETAGEEIAFFFEPAELE